MKEWGICMQGNEICITSAILEAVKHNPGNIFRYLEIGVAEGKTFSAVCTLLDLVTDQWLAYAVDLENGWSFNLEEFEKNTQIFGDRVSLNLQGSPAFARHFSPESLNAILIDGDHSQEAVENDFYVADEILMPGGIIIFHDTDDESQGLDPQPSNGETIAVKKAIRQLGLLSFGSNYKLILNYQGDKSKGGRGIIIMEKEY
jgi:predicted O-methyltransferase YrrM